MMKVPSGLGGRCVEDGLPGGGDQRCPVLDAGRFQEAHEARVCIHDGVTLDDQRRVRRYSDQQYFKSIEEMCALFEDIPEALQNTLEIAKRCNVDVRLGKLFSTGVSRAGWNDHG